MPFDFIIGVNLIKVEEQAGQGGRPFKKLRFSLYLMWREGNMSSSRTLSRAFVLGAISGLRSLIGTALLSNDISHRHNLALKGTPLAPLADEKVSRVLSVLSAGEIVADKLPAIPSRIQPGPLIGRALFGVLAGAAVCAEEKQPVAAGAAIGAVAAVAASYGAYYLRRWLS
jgi:uncharacterized membrane protein